MVWLLNLRFFIELNWPLEPTLTYASSWSLYCPFQTGVYTHSLKFVDFFIVRKIIRLHSDTVCSCIFFHFFNIFFLPLHTRLICARKLAAVNPFVSHLLDIFVANNLLGRKNLSNEPGSSLEQQSPKIKYSAHV